MFTSEKRDTLALGNHVVTIASAIFLVGGSWSKADDLAVDANIERVMLNPKVEGSGNCEIPAMSFHLGFEGGTKALGNLIHASGIPAGTQVGPAQLKGLKFKASLYKKADSEFPQWGSFEKC